MSRRNNFDFIRFLLAALVIFGHAFVLPVGDESRDLLFRFSHGQMFSGRLAVLSFFCISGLLITLSWQHSKQWVDYLKKRILRIYPGFIVAALITIFIAGPLGSDNLSAYWHALNPLWLLGKIVTLDPFKSVVSFATNPYPFINGSLWTIQPEFVCYLAVMLLGGIGLLRRQPGMLYLVVGALALLYWRDELHPSHKLDTLRWYLPTYVLFSVGMLCAIFRERIVYTARGALVCFLLLLAACFVPHGLAFVTPFALPYALFWLAQTPRLRMQDWSQRVGGDYSYGLYLYSFPIEQVLLRYVHAAQNPLVLFALAFPLSLGVAWLSWHGIEKPFLRLKKTAAQKDTLPLHSQTNIPAQIQTGQD